MTDAEGSLAETDEQMVTHKGTLKSKNTELMETDKYLAGVHADCDLLLSTTTCARRPALARLMAWARDIGIEANDIVVRSDSEPALVNVMQLWGSLRTLKGGGNMI